MFDTYENYKKITTNLMNGNAASYMKAVEDGLVVEKKYNTNGEPYRLLTRDEWNSKFKPSKYTY